MTSDDMTGSKGLEFPVVALPGVGHMPSKGDDEQEAARVFYVAATRASQRLVIGVGGDGDLENIWPPKRVAALKFN
jgi:superfamily I DNA/RNA helicase